MRDCLLGWNGYKILKINLVSKMRFVDKDAVIAKSLAEQALREVSIIQPEEVEREISEGERDCSDIEA